MSAPLKLLAAKLLPQPRFGFPRGWYRGDGTLGCCHDDCPPVAIRKDEPIFLTGEPGEAYCTTHAECAEA